MTHHINSYTKDHLHYATDTNLGFRKKIELVASSKISICYNLVHVMSDQIERIIKYRALGRNEAFSTVGFWNVMPQFKTRMHEAALSKSINLVRRDQWNVVERFYKPNVDFIYFETESELPRVIDAILSKWDSDHIQGIVESAYQRVKRYSTANFVRDLEAFCKSSVS